VALVKESRIEDGVPSWVSLEVRLPNVEMHRIVRYGKERIRGAVSQSAALAVDIRHATVKAKRLISHCVEKASALVRAQDLRAVRITHTGPVAATLGVLLLSTVVALGLGGHTRPAAAAPAVVRSLQSSQSSDPQSSSLSVTANSLTAQVPASLSAFDTASPANASEAVTTKEVDLNVDPGVGSGSESLSASPEESTPSQETSASIVKKVKAQSESQTPTPSNTQKNSGQLKIRRLVSASVRTQQTRTPPSAAPEIANEAKGQKTVDARPDLPATALAVSSSDPAPNKRTSVGDQQKAQESKTESTESYLEVGSFKDASWSDKAVDQLSRLGFHAVSVHKSHLWMQSYHVEVGPYTNPGEIEAAQRSLASQNFTSHLVK
jgi:SPOR domain